jgi:hypothetical protein
VQRNKIYFTQFQYRVKRILCAATKSILDLKFHENHASALGNTGGLPPANGRAGRIVAHLRGFPPRPELDIPQTLHNHFVASRHALS